MHIVLGLLATIVTILILLNRLRENGIDIGWLNPFTWHRRRQWREQHHGNPIYAIEQPLDVAALLMLTVAKRDGDLAASEKARLLELYREEFHLSEREASALLSSSAHLLGAGDAFTYNLHKVLEPSKERFTAEQAESTVALMEDVAGLDGGASELQREFIEDVRTVLLREQQPAGKWG